MLTREWRKSRASGGGSNCVEVRLVDGCIQVRDTKDAGRGPVLSFTESEWAAFEDGMLRREFALPGRSSGR
ncbi:DUF397 domain-containing protein [Nonomuraea sp. NPDC059194]|uniref:DUF397 domain-containing protein n=1 Tax=Nonomuraea sp. NPDC059194 TaxID=3346764 RepID=UPI00369F07D1